MPVPLYTTTALSSKDADGPCCTASFIGRTQMAACTIITNDVVLSGHLSPNNQRSQTVLAGHVLATKEAIQQELPMS